MAVPTLSGVPASERIGSVSLTVVVQTRESDMTPSTRAPETFLPLHPLEFRILMILVEGAAHGYAVVQEIEERGDLPGKVYPANLYRRIRDLLAKGLLEDAHAVEEPSADARRRYFRLTGLGHEVARAEAHRMEELLGEARGRGLLQGMGG